MRSFYSGPIFRKKIQTIIQNETLSKECINDLKRTSEILSGNIKVGVFGEIAAGKSTFMNVLLGRKLLQQGLGETTKTINIFKHGSNDTQTICYCDGSIKNKKGLNDIGVYLEEKAKDLKKIEITLNNEALDGLEVIDTPGLGSNNDRHTALSKTISNECDLFVFIIKIDSKITPVSGLVDFFKYLSSKNIKINKDNSLFILNKIDLVDSGHISGEKQKLREEINSYLDISDPVIIDISAELAMWSKFVRNNDKNIDWKEYRRLVFLMFSEKDCSLCFDGLPCVKEAFNKSRFYLVEEKFRMFVDQKESILEKRVARYTKKILKDEKIRLKNIYEKKISSLNKHLGTFQKELDISLACCVENKMKFVADQFLSGLHGNGGLFSFDSTLVSQAYNKFGFNKVSRSFYEAVESNYFEEINRSVCFDENSDLKTILLKKKKFTDLKRTFFFEDITKLQLDFRWTSLSCSSFKKSHNKRFCEVFRASGEGFVIEVVERFDEALKEYRSDLKKSDKDVENDVNKLIELLNSY